MKSLHLVAALMLLGCSKSDPKPQTLFSTSFNPATDSVVIWPMLTSQDVADPPAQLCAFIVTHHKVLVGIPSKLTVAQADSVRSYCGGEPYQQFLNSRP